MKRPLLVALTTLLLCSSHTLQAKVEHLLPQVQVLTPTADAPFALGRPVNIVYEGITACQLLEELFTTHGCTLGAGGATVSVTLVDSIAGAYDYELYGYDNEA